MRWARCLLVLLCLAGCVDKDKVPSGIIPREQMSGILWDLLQADQYSDVYLVKDSSRNNLKAETLKLYSEVFHLHHVSLDDFRKSFKFYLDHPDLTRGLFDTVMNRGNRQREVLLKPGSGPGVAPHSKPVSTPPITIPGRPHGLPPGAAPKPPVKRPFSPGSIPK